MSGPLNVPTATTTQYLGGGTHSLTAVYLGDTTHASSTSVAVPLTLATSAQVVSLTTPVTMLALGSSTTFTVTVPTVANGSAPAGSVRLFDGTDPSLPTYTIAAGTLNSSGAVTFTVTPTTPGQHGYYATYAGDANYQAIRSANNVIVSVQAATTTTLSVAGTMTYGNTLTITGSVVSTPVTTPLPTGTINVSDNGTPLAGIVLASSMGTQQVFFTGGSHSLVGAYGGDNNYTGSTSSAKAFTVAPAVGPVGLTVGAASLSVGGSTTLTAKLGQVAGGVYPTGSVSFYAGTTLLGTGTITNQGVAIYLATFNSAGSHSLTAQYGGDGNYTMATSAATVVTVANPSITLTASPATATLRPGGTTSSNLVIAPGGGFSGTVALTCASPVAYVTCSPAPASVALMLALAGVSGCGGAKAASAPTPAPPPAGTQTLTITAASGSVSASAQVVVTITN